MAKKKKKPSAARGPLLLTAAERRKLQQLQKKMVRLRARTSATLKAIRKQEAIEKAHFEREAREESSR